MGAIVEAAKTSFNHDSIFQICLRSYTTKLPSKIFLFRGRTQVDEVLTDGCLLLIANFELNCDDVTIRSNICHPLWVHNFCLAIMVIGLYEKAVQKRCYTTRAFCSAMTQADHVIGHELVFLSRLQYDVLQYYAVHDAQPTRGRRLSQESGND